MLKVGLTGGIGSGKTTVATMFELLGIPVYYADDRAKYLMQQDATVRAQIVGAFGKSAYDTQGNLDRKYLAGQVFENPKELAKLNNIVHPAVRTDFATWCSEQADVPYVLKEAALIFETGGNKSLDFMILVWAPEDMRIERVVSRDNIDASAVRSRMNNQMTDHEKVPLADCVIVNDGAHALVRQVMEVHHLLEAMSSGENGAQES